MHFTHTQKNKNHSISSHVFPRGHNSRQGQRQGSARWSVRHEARQAREGQQGRLHGNLRELQWQKHLGQPQCCNGASSPPGLDQLLSSWKPPLREHLRHPTSIPALLFPEPCSPHLHRQPSPQAHAQEGSPIPKKVEGRDDYPEVTGV